MGLKLIAVSEQNYFALKELGRAGDSFNDVITLILKNQGQRRLDEWFDNDSDVNGGRNAHQDKKES